MLLYLLVCAQKRDSVPGWLPVTRAERQFVVDITRTGDSVSEELHLPCRISKPYYSLLFSFIFMKQKLDSILP